MMNLCIPYIDYPSPNYAERTYPVSYVVLHGTWMADDSAALARLCDPAAEVSCHYLIAADGLLYKLVDEGYMAWHAGKSRWQGLEGLNAHSIGIELSNPGGPPFNVPYTEAQYHTLEDLLRDILLRHNLPPENVLGHEHIAPGRKNDPGPLFDWQRLATAGLATVLEPLDNNARSA